MMSSVLLAGCSGDSGASMSLVAFSGHF